MPQGILIDVESIDAAGKGTQCRALEERLRRDGFKVLHQEFPVHGAPAAYLIDEMLRGKYGPITKVDPRVASMMYIQERFDANILIKPYYEDGYIVVCDRYASSNKGHQVGKLKTNAKKKKMLAFLNEWEFQIHGNLRPDITLLLDVPVEIARELLLKKARRKYTGNDTSDEAEKSVEHQIASLDAFRYVARKEGWSVIQCVENNLLLPPEIIHEKVYAAVQPVLAKVK